MIKGKHQQEVVGMLKKLSGDELFDVVDSLNKIKSNPHEKSLYSYYEPDKKSISTADNLFVFLHELGHAKDAAVKRKDTPDNDNEFYVGNKNIRRCKYRSQNSTNSLPVYLSSFTSGLCCNPPSSSKTHDGWLLSPLLLPLLF